MNNVSLKDTLPALQSQKTQEGISKHSRKTSGPKIKVEPDTDQLGLSLQYDIFSSDKMRKHNAWWGWRKTCLCLLPAWKMNLRDCSDWIKSRLINFSGLIYSPIHLRRVTNTGRSSEWRVRESPEGERPYLMSVILSNLVCEENILTEVSLPVLREQHRAPKHLKRARPNRRLWCSFQATRRMSLWRKGGGGAPRAEAAHMHTGPGGFGVINGTGMRYSRHPPRTYRSVFL